MAHAKRVIVRHGQSEWNAQNKFTGWVNVDLAPKGIAEAKEAGEKLKGFKFDKGFTSALLRAQRTLKLARTYYFMHGKASPAWIPTSMEGKI